MNSSLSSVGRKNELKVFFLLNNLMVLFYMVQRYISVVLTDDLLIVHKI